MSSFFLAGCALVLATTAGPASLKIMVMDVTSVPKSEAVAAAAVELITVELSRYRQLEVASLEDVKQLLKLESGRQTVGQCGDETSCMMAVAGALGAELIVYGKATPLGQLTLVTLHLYDVASARSLGRSSLTIRTLEELPARMEPAILALIQPLADRGLKLQPPVAAAGTGRPAIGKRTPRATTVSLANLEALANQGAFQELLTRALEIPPRLRDKAWLDLVSNAAAKHLEKTRRRDPFAAFLLDENYGDLYPRATRASSYHRVRSQVATEGLQACFQKAASARRAVWRDRMQIPDCARLADAYAKRAQPSVDEALVLGKLVRRNVHGSRAVGLFLLAAPTSSAAACKESELASVVVSGLAEKPGSQPAEDAKILAFERCFAAVKPALKRELARAGHDAFFINACPGLLSHKALRGLQTKRCKRKLKKRAAR